MTFDGVKVLIREAAYDKRSRVNYTNDLQRRGGSRAHVLGSTHEGDWRRRSDWHHHSSSVWKSFSLYSIRCLRVSVDLMSEHWGKLWKIMTLIARKVDFVENSKRFVAINFETFKSFLRSFTTSPITRLFAVKNIQVMESEWKYKQSQKPINHLIHLRHDSVYWHHHCEQTSSSFTH